MTTQPVTPRRNIYKLYASEAFFEFIKLLRLPIYSVSVLAFPVLFFMFFGVMYGAGETQGIAMGKYMVAGISAAGVLSASMFGFGVGVASERGQGWMRLKRVSPMPPLAYFAAKIIMAFIFSSLVVIALTVVAYFMGLAEFAVGEWFRMYATAMLGVFPFAALGLAVGYLFGPNSAPLVVNLLFTPLSFASGLWIPYEALPEALQHVATFLPTFHYAQLVLRVVGAEPVGALGTHVLVLVLTTLLFLALAVWAYYHDEGRTYG